MRYTCDVCCRERDVKPIETDSGIIRVCSWCINSNKLCPLGCKYKDIKCIDCVELSKFEKME
jgi:hypothetical protein